jgi:hypothetical protein
MKSVSATEVYHRTLCLIVGILLAMIAAVKAYGDTLCVHGHPAKRAAHITYGGLPAKPGYQRDHWCSLGLGCPDILANVHYQRCFKTGPYGRCESGPAADKDKDEHTAEEKMCGRRWALEYARQWLAAGWPVDVAHGYDQP